MRFNKNDKQIVEKILKCFGIKVDKESKEFKVQYRGEKLPSIAYRKKEDLYCLYYQAPNGFGQQSFLFSFDDFRFCFNQKDFELLDGNPNDYVLFAFEMFYVNLTVLRQLRRNKRSGVRKLRLDRLNVKRMLKCLEN